MNTQATPPSPEPTLSVERWTQEQIEHLKSELLLRHLLDPLWVKCADALGSLQFDLVDALCAAQAPQAREDEWRCFHCDEVFTAREAAAGHFGVQIDGCADDVACKLNATEGLLVKMLREAQEELRQYHQEDNAAFKQFYSLGADHATALRREEEKGYARGLHDGRALSEPPR